MRIYLTGASGFVGSNLAHVFGAGHGAEVISPGHEHVDLTDELVVRRSVLATRPDAIVHAAIWNDPAGLRADRRRAWEAYVGATRNVVAAANAIDAHVVLISTDWVFDGTQGPATESEPSNPINTYGFLKAASEIVVRETAGRWTIARIAGVQGVHRARPSLPRAQDAGFGYLIEVVAPPDGAAGAEPVPVDTRLDACATARVLGVEMPALDVLLGRLRAEVESSWCPA